MRLPSFQTSSESRTPSIAQALIGGGLALLVLAAWLPIVPVVTGMAMIALGSTELTLARFRGAAVFVPALAIHAVTYAGLYALFIGATLHAFTVTSATRMGMWTALDLAASVVPMAIVLQHIFGEIRQSLSSKQ